MRLMRVEFMASDGEDDYLSDKFLLESVAAAAPPKKPLTYAERRKQAQRQSEIKNVQNRNKSRLEREAETLEEGLHQSLFERAKAEEQELGTRNKAMSMMLQMGFKPGESLGRSDSTGPSNVEAGPSTAPAPVPVSTPQEPAPVTNPAPTASILLTSKQGSEPQHRTAPLSVDIWTGKKGVGLGKRKLSPGAAERASKAARADEETERETYRSRTREAFEERRVMGQLINASRTLLSLDEKAGIQFNVLSLDPQDPTTFPPELLEALSSSPDVQNAVVSSGAQDSESERLRKQMQLDALQPLEELLPDGDGDGDEGAELPKKDVPLPLSLSDESIDEVREFLRMGARDRLSRVLHYLREKYHYCFWCGVQYSNRENLDGNCPGEEEEAHD